MATARAKEDRTALADRVYDDLLRAIVTGELSPGAWLKERELSERFDVSRIPVRQALQRLESEGFVVTTPNRGAKVTPVTRADIEDLFDARLCIEPFAVRRAAERVRDGEPSDRLREVLDQALHPREHAELGAANLRFHVEMVRLSGNSLLLRSLTPMIGRMEWIFRLTQSALEREHAMEHQQLFDSIAAGRPELAAAQAFAHIELAREPLIAALADILEW
ncbi:GntR family transcriptional regulator [Microbacterium sp.]|uniref:GntR family transcriptional regulator n=1 Tax=Microbacterium sp. TaxID=51671 RepID=UPI0028123990|nr:GntR family transcriptional regulator [Microbacterium sp.]